MTKLSNNIVSRLSLVALLCIATAVPSRLESQEILAPLSSSSRIITHKSSDTLILELPFFDDFAEYEGAPDRKRWLTFQAFVNKSYAPQAPTVGIVTLDALNEYGDLYPQASTNLFMADTLASQIIRLDSLTGTYQRKLNPSDSIYFSFFYLPGGWYGNAWELIGDAPSTQDSLFLEFYNGEEWNKVWATGGFNADTTGIQSHWPWRFVNIKIDDPIYFNKSFQFRFRNYASLDSNPKSGIAGNCDQWNIDYIYIDLNRTASDSIFRDVAFAEKAPSMLKDYQSMPARQYQPSDMASELQMSIVNRYNQTLASTYSYTILDESGTNIASYDGGYENIPAFFPNGNYQTMPVHSSPPVNFSFPASDNQSEYKIIHVVREGVSGDNRSGNDTVVFTQRFSDYYALDDGTPENGYGLTSSGNHLWMACRYDLRQSDTLTALDLFFNRTRNGENEDIQFRICVWNCLNGKPSNQLYSDATRNTPEFDGMNRFHRYRLTTPIVVSDTVFIGIEQFSNSFINIGFDRNNDARSHTYYRTGNEWLQSILSGAIMMRPAFGVSALVSLEPIDATSPYFTLYPNPANSYVNIGFAKGKPSTIELFDIRGHKIWQKEFSSTICLDGLSAGIYLIRITDTATGIKATKKLIISR